MHPTFRFFLLLLGHLILGCAHPTSSPDALPPPSLDFDEQIFNGDTIEQLYDPLVMLKRGDVFFDRTDYPSAISEYERFLSLHRTHRLAPYAHLKVAQSYLNTVTALDRDPAPIASALSHYETITSHFPTSRYRSEAVSKIQSCHEHLAQITFMIGKFYQRQEAWLAAAHRFEEVVTTYPETSAVPDARYALALVYHQLELTDWARAQLVTLVQDHPSSPHTADAHHLLAALGLPSSTHPLTTVLNPSSTQRPSRPEHHSSGSLHHP